MSIERSTTKLAVVMLIVLHLSSCATYHRIDGVSDYTQLVLRTGDSVKVTTKNNTKVDLTIQKTDSEYLYGEDEGVVIKKSDIRSMELSRSESEKYYGIFLGILALSFMFSG